MWKRLFRQPLPHLSLPFPPLPLPTEPGLYLIYELVDNRDYQNPTYDLQGHITS